MSCAVERIKFVCPDWSEWTGVFATDPITAGTEQANVVELDMGSASSGTNTDAKAVSLEFPDSFDDSVFASNGFHIWLANDPGLADHVWAAEFEGGALFPAVSLDAVLAGTTAKKIASNPWDTARHIGTAGEYDAATTPSDKRIATILLQLQLGAASALRNSKNELTFCPWLIAEFPRMDAGVTTLRPDSGSFDEEAGHFFAFSEMKIWEISDSVGVQGSTERWNLLGSIRDSTVEMTANREIIEWRRGKPLTTVHQAISDATAVITFAFDQPTPDFEARSNQTTAQNFDSRATVGYAIDGRSCNNGVIERGYCVEWTTIGGFIKRAYVPRGVLKRTGAVMPGGESEFASQQFEITGLAAGVNKILLQEECTKTPVEQAILPIAYAAA